MTRYSQWMLMGLILVVLGSGLGIFCIYLPAKKRLAPTNHTNPAVFFSPHPDDETLNMGITISKCVEGGRPVYIVLLTHGRESGALWTINKSLKAQHKMDMYGPINRDQFEVARIKEFKKAGEALGVPQDHMFIEYLDKGKMAITYPETKEVTKKYVQMFPNADFYALSWLDVHYDHRVSGEALRDLYEKKELNLKEEQLHFLISMQTRMSMDRKGVKPPGVRERSGSYVVNKRVRAAMKAYNEWNPKKGSYAVGFISVRRQFRKLNHDMVHYMHGVDLKKFPQQQRRR